MIPPTARDWRDGEGIPRESGDDPSTAANDLDANKYSPRERG